MTNDYLQKKEGAGRVSQHSPRQILDLEIHIFLAVEL